MPHNVHVLIPKSLRQDWVDLMALDERLTALAVRAGIVVAVRCIRNETGVGFIGLDKVASLLGVSRRTAWSAITLLVKHGYLGIKQRGHGKGRANEYEMLLDKVQPVARLAHEKLATRCSLLWGPSGNGLHLGAGVNVQNPASQGAAHCTPSLTYPSGSSLEPAHRLGAAGDRLRQKIGGDLFASWFRDVDVTIEEHAGGKAAVLHAPSRFAATTIATKFVDDVLACWRADDPSITATRVLVRQGHSHSAGAS